MTKEKPSRWSELQQVKVILIGTTHPGNIGSVARAMKVMSQSDLALISPKVFPSEIASAMASGAENILQNIDVYNDVSEALGDVSVVYGCTARGRQISLPVLTPENAAQEVVNHRYKAALLFGRESSGLTNKELSYCQRIVEIPTNNDFRSLNLSHAVQICLYELFKTHLLVEEKLPNNFLAKEEVANVIEVEKAKEHLIQVMKKTKFLGDLESSITIERRINRLISKKILLKSEIKIIRGFLKSIDNVLK